MEETLNLEKCRDARFDSLKAKSKISIGILVETINKDNAENSLSKQQRPQLMQSVGTELTNATPGGPLSGNEAK